MADEKRWKIVVETNLAFNNKECVEILGQLTQDIDKYPHVKNIKLIFE